MASDNGAGTPANVAELEADLGIGDDDPVAKDLDKKLGNAPKLRLDPGKLTMRDLKRAKVVLGGQDPFELLQDPLEAVVLTIWCLKSRTDVAFTWDQAETCELDEFDLEGDDAPPPRTASPEPSGSRRGRSTGSTPKPRRSSAASTT